MTATQTLLVPPRRRSRLPSGGSTRRHPWGAQIASAVIALGFLFPLYILVNVSLKPSTGPINPLVPSWPLNWSNFAEAWVVGELGRALVNSLIVTTLSTAAVVILAALAAYPLARSTARWSRASTNLFLLGLMLPFQISMIPLYLTFRDFGLLGTLPGIIIFQIGAGLPFAVFMYATFLRNSEREYEEAAAIDGCGILRTFWHVVLPLTRPVTGTVAILTAINVWNEFFAPLLFLNGGEETVPLALYGFVSEEATQWNLIFAGLILGMAPILIVYLFMQKSIIKGFAGGLKG